MSKNIQKRMLKPKSINTEKKKRKEKNNAQKTTWL